MTTYLSTGENVNGTSVEYVPVESCNNKIGGVVV